MQRRNLPLPLRDSERHVGDQHNVTFLHECWGETDVLFGSPADRVRFPWWVLSVCLDLGMALG